MVDQLLPLAVVQAADDETVEGITRLQKLVFLVQREGERCPYEFDAGDYGPFSSQLYDDLDALVERGYLDRTGERTELDNQKHVYELTDHGRRALANADPSDFPVDREHLSSVVSDYSDESLWELLEYVYESYPRLTRNSKLSI